MFFKNRPLYPFEKEKLAFLLLSLSGSIHYFIEQSLCSVIILI